MMVQRNESMRKTSEVLFKWGSASVLVAVPLIACLSWITPDLLQLEIEAPVAYTVSVETGEGDGGESITGGTRSARSAYRAGAPEPSKVVFSLDGRHGVSQLGLSFRTEPCIVTVRSIAHRSGLLWTRRLDFSKVSSCFSTRGDVEIVDDNPNFLRLKFSGAEGRLVPKSSSSVAWRLDLGGRKVLKLFLTAIFVGLLILSLLVSRGRKDEFSWPRGLCQSAVVALFAAVFNAIILPIQSYLVNQSDFGFTLVDLFKDTTVDFAVLFISLLILLYLLMFSWGRFFHVVLVFVLIYEYLETGVLAIGLPPLNGEISYFVANRTRGLLDLGVFVALVGAAALCWRWLKESIHWVALAFLILSVVSVFDVHPDLRMSANLDSAVIRDFNTKDDVAKSAVYSTKRNVMVFVLDMVSSEVAEDILCQDDELRTKFDGFTCYRNNVGMHMCTEVGSAGMLTGKYFNDPATLTEYVYSVFGSNSVLSCYAQADIPVYSLPGAMKFGYTNKPRRNDKLGSATVRTLRNSLTWRMEDQQKWSLAEVVRFRATPFIAKAIVFGKIVSSWPSQGDIHDESQLYPILSKCSTTDEHGMTFHWYHTTGTHPPLQVDRFGHAISEARFGYDAHREKAWYALRLLGKLFDVYRKKKVYDNSMIVVCADHAAGYENGKAYVKAGLPSRALPMLWVKPMNAHGNACESNLPTSHVKLAELIKTAKSNDLSMEEIEGILRTEDRVFREAGGKGLYDWHVDATGHVEKIEVALSRPAEKLKPLAVGRLYSFLAMNKEEKADVVFENIDWSGAGQPRIFGQEKSATMRFKVTTGPCQVRLNIHTMIAQTGGRQKYTSDDPRFEISANGMTPVRAWFDEKTENAEVELKNVLPDSEGIIELRFARKGFNDQVFLVNIMVDVN